MVGNSLVLLPGKTNISKCFCPSFYINEPGFIGFSSFSR